MMIETHPSVNTYEYFIYTYVKEDYNTCFVELC
jgi:hypothetical protein